MNSIVSYCKKFGLIILSLLFLFSGCASPKKLLDLEQEINQLKITVEVLEKSNVEMNMKLDSLTDSVKRIEESVQVNIDNLRSVMTEKTITEKTRFEKENTSDYM